MIPVISYVACCFKKADYNVYAYQNLICAYDRVSWMRAPNVNAIHPQIEPANANLMVELEEKSGNHQRRWTSSKQAETAAPKATLLARG